MTAGYPITEEQVRFYEENGYIQLLGVLTPGELEQVRAALDEVMAMQLDQQHDLSRGRPDYERIFVQKVNLWQVHARVFLPTRAGAGCATPRAAPTLCPQHWRN